MPSYDALHYDPPVPIARVMLRAANGATVLDIPLLLGALASIPIPLFNMNWSALTEGAA